MKNARFYGFQDPTQKIIKRFEYFFIFQKRGRTSRFASCPQTHYRHKFRSFFKNRVECNIFVLTLNTTLTSVLNFKIFLKMKQAKTLHEIAFSRTLHGLTFPCTFLDHSNLLCHFKHLSPVLCHIRQRPTPYPLRILNRSYYKELRRIKKKLLNMLLTSLEHAPACGCGTIIYLGYM